MDTKKIGAFIAENRKKKGLTQEQLGERLHVTNKTVSRWERGNYMPDLSLLEPLSRELDVTLNELLVGEAIAKDKVGEYSEKNLSDTLDYSARKIKNEHLMVSLILFVIGVMICFIVLTTFPSDSSKGELGSLLGVGIIAVGVFREIPFRKIWQKLLASLLSFVIIISALFVADYLGVIEYQRPPVFRYLTIYQSGPPEVIEYRNLFYSVYIVNPNSPNKYTIVDTDHRYTIDTLPKSPFYRTKSGIDEIIRYNSHYIGNNANTGGLINSLPLAENGFVFKIDSEDLGLKINYYMTSWYDEHYTNQALVYNSAAFFVLIDNLEYIDYIFSGDSYHIDRSVFQDNLPGFKDIKKDGVIDSEAFNTYIEAQMFNDQFINDMIALFARNEN